MIVSVISFTQKGLELSEKLAQSGDRQDRYRLFSKWRAMPDGKRAVRITELGEWTREQFEAHHALLFIGACGIAVRSVAPCVESKLSDSPVLVMDEDGRYVIPILSGHVGGANRLAGKIAQATGAEAVLTTATDVNGKFAVDVFAAEQGFQVQNKEGIGRVSTKILAGGRVKLAAEGFSAAQCREYLEKRLGMCPPEVAPVDFQKNGDSEQCLPVDIVIAEDGQCLPSNVVNVEGGRRFSSVDVRNVVGDRPSSSADILISEKSGWQGDILWLKPKVYILGMGCKKGKDFRALFSFVQKELDRCQISAKELYALASIDRKQDEDGLLDLADYLRIPFFTYPEEALAGLEGDFCASDFVRQTVGVDNVCERAALACCGGRGEFVLRKTVMDGMTLAIVRRDWRSPGDGIV